MREQALLCINTETGKATRYVRTQLLGMRLRQADSVEIVGYNAYKPIADTTLGALENFRRNGTLG